MNGRCGLALVAALALVGGISACASTASAAPRCSSIERVALVAQSVPTTSYVPCLGRLPAGWSSGRLDVHDGGTEFTLHSDRSAAHPVEVALAPTCRPGTATPLAARTPGGRTYLRLAGIDPRFAGTMYDVFPGGCVTYRFDFPRGAHIALIAELQSAVKFLSRQELRLALRRRLGVDLDR